MENHERETEPRRLYKLGKFAGVLSTMVFWVMIRGLYAPNE
jgi:hypothetical protein